MWKTKEARRLTGSRKPDEGDLHRIYEGGRHLAVGWLQLLNALRLALLRPMIT